MNVIKIILLPFVFIYKGFISVLLIPYYFVLGIVKLFELIFKKKDNKVKKDIALELKPNEKIKVVKEVKNAYESKNLNNNITMKTAEEKDKYAIKKQKEFEKLVKKAKLEEEKRAKEQLKLKIEREKKEALRKKKEELIKQREEERENKRLAKEEALRKEGKPATFYEKLKAFYKKLTINKKELLELEAKKSVLDEQFKDDKNNQSRFTSSIIFNYVAKNKDGEIEKGSIEALSRVDVHSFLVAEGYEVYDITAAKQKGLEFIKIEMKKSKLIFYLSQLSAYLKSGISLAQAVKILSDQAKRKSEKDAWKAVYYDLSMGDELSVALEKRNKVFPKLLINMIKTAEMTGNLPETLDDMVNYYTESETTRKQMKSAMTYPIIVTVFAMIVVTFILIWVVPQFVDIYDDLGSELPTITKIVISISDFLKNYLIYLLLGIIVLCIIYIFLFRNIKQFRKVFQEFFMHLPVIGNIIIYN